MADTCGVWWGHNINMQTFNTIIMIHFVLLFSSVTFFFLHFLFWGCTMLRCFNRCFFFCFILSRNKCLFFYTAFQCQCRFVLVVHTDQVLSKTLTATDELNIELTNILVWTTYSQVPFIFCVKAQSYSTLSQSSASPALISQMIVVISIKT